MPINFSQIKKKINGQVDPFDPDSLKLRVGVVDALNGDGTVDLLISGVLMTDVPKLSGVVVGEDESVQVLTYRGSMIVIGGVASNDAAIGQQPFVRDAAKSDSSAVTAETVVSTLASRTYKAGRAYMVWVGGGVSYNAASLFSAWNLKKGTTTGGTTVVSFPRQTNGVNTANQELHLNLQAPFIVGASDVTTQLCLTLTVNGVGPNTVTHKGSNANPRHLTILPAGFASAWTNAAILS